MLFGYQRRKLFLLRDRSLLVPLEVFPTVLTSRVVNTSVLEFLAAVAHTWHPTSFSLVVNLVIVCPCGALRARTKHYTAANIDNNYFEPSMFIIHRIVLYYITSGQELNDITDLPRSKDS